MCTAICLGDVPVTQNEQYTTATSPNQNKYQQFNHHNVQISYNQTNTSTHIHTHTHIPSHTNTHTTKRAITCRFTYTGPACILHSLTNDCPPPPPHTHTHWIPGWEEEELRTNKRGDEQSRKRGDSWGQEDYDDAPSYQVWLHTVERFKRYLEKNVDRTHRHSDSNMPYPPPPVHLLQKYDTMPTV